MVQGRAGNGQGRECDVNISLNQWQVGLDPKGPKFDARSTAASKTPLRVKLCPFARGQREAGDLACVLLVVLLWCIRLAQG